MENLKENKNKIIELKKKNYELNENIKTLEEKTRYLYHNNYEEFKNNDNKIKELKNKIKLNKIKIAILKNNIHYLFKMDFEGIKAKMLDYYENKKIGEKTKEKMENELQEYFKNNYDINIRCYISLNNDYSYNELSFTFYFLNNEGYKDFTLDYNEEFKIQFAKYKYNNYELTINYYNNINEYIEIKEINKKANNLLKEYTKTTEKIEKLRLQQKELYHNFKDYIQAFVYNELDIKTDLRIY